MFCPNCGSQLPDDASFCPACSTKITSPEVSQKQTKSIPNSAILIAALSVLAIVFSFLRWFEVRYLNYISDKSAFSIIDLFRMDRDFSDFAGNSRNMTVSFFLIGVIAVSLVYLLGVVRILMNQPEKAYPLTGVASILAICFAATVFIISLSNEMKIMGFTIWFYLYFIAALIDGIISWKYALDHSRS